MWEDTSAAFTKEHLCHLRAMAYHSWCGNAQSEGIIAKFMPSGKLASYPPEFPTVLPANQHTKPDGGKSDVEAAEVEEDRAEDEEGGEEDEYGSLSLEDGGKESDKASSSMRTDVENEEDRAMLEKAMAVFERRQREELAQPHKGKFLILRFNPYTGQSCAFAPLHCSVRVTDARSGLCPTHLHAYSVHADMCELSLTIWLLVFDFGNSPKCATRLRESFLRAHFGCDDVHGRGSQLSRSSCPSLLLCAPFAYGLRACLRCPILPTRLLRETRYYLRACYTVSSTTYTLDTWSPVLSGGMVLPGNGRALLVDWPEEQVLPLWSHALATMSE